MLVSGRVGNEQKSNEHWWLEDDPASFLSGASSAYFQGQFLLLVAGRIALFS